MSIFIFDWNCLLHKCFVYRPLWSRTKGSARCEWLLQSVTDHRKRKEYRGFLLPAVPCAQIYIVRETSRNETLARTFAVLTLNHPRRAKNVYVLRGIEYLRYLRSISSAFSLRTWLHFPRQYRVERRGVDSAYERGGDARCLAYGFKFQILASLRVVWAKRHHI